MSSRTRARRRTAASVHSIHIPRQRGRRGSQPFIVVVPEHPSLTREAFGFAGRLLWRFRSALAPTLLALLALALTAVMHALSCWYGLVFLPVALAPAAWLGIMHVRRPRSGSTLYWRITASAAVTLAVIWLLLAAVFGPFAGPLEGIWLSGWILAQAAWLIVRRSL
ncbi:hypothetical protein [Streptomyces sp. GbtcB6]|uniref:hypothetical protein n=1 Tax=Streptomyces sp. GbtcB6 TaxID=2824751 RepID=UPI001C2F532B|nr:hypothetical protein [Streptomyces sp. GbtcB6]